MLMFPWCSWLSRKSNTLEVSSSSLGTDRPVLDLSIWSKTCGPRNGPGDLQSRPAENSTAGKGGGKGPQFGPGSGTIRNGRTSSHCSLEPHSSTPSSIIMPITNSSSSMPPPWQRAGRQVSVTVAPPRAQAAAGASSAQAGEERNEVHVLMTAEGSQASASAGDQAAHDLAQLLPPSPDVSIARIP